MMFGTIDQRWQMMRSLSEVIVLIKGGGEVASGTAHMLHRSHLRVCLTEIGSPLAVSRGTAFCEAVFDGEKTIEGVTAELVPTSVDEIHRVWQEGNIAIVVDPETSIRERLRPDVLVDATMAKRNTGIKLGDAPLVIGLGPGFYAGRDVHIVVETNHSSNLGRVILEGEAEENTGIPVAIGGLTRERVVWAPQSGIFVTDMEIGDPVVAGQIVGWVGDQPVEAPLSGMLRGLMRNAVKVPKGAKLLEVDPVHDKDICDLITDKMRIIGVGVLEAIKLKFNTMTNSQLEVREC
jgi:xanthine dehydrogenase accessory factor